VRIRSVFNHTAQVIAEGALLSLLVVGLMAGTAFAAKPTGNAGTGTCAANPNPVSLGTEYSVAGAGLKAGEVINVYIHDALGTTVKSTAADAAGTWSVSSWASIGGTSTVDVKDMWGKHPATRASCSFSVG
jgi:hypothetical protein